MQQWVALGLLVYFEYLGISHCVRQTNSTLPQLHQDVVIQIPEPGFKDYLKNLGCMVEIKAADIITL